MGIFPKIRVCHNINNVSTFAPQFMQIWYETFIYPCVFGTSVWCLRTKQNNEYERAKHHYDSGMGQDVPSE